MSSSVDVLFRPFTLNAMTLANRIVMAPMTRSFSPGAAPGEDVAAYYRRRAEGGVGLILTEGVHPNRTTAQGTPDVPTIARRDADDGWRRVVEGVHEAGGKIGVQLWHEGPMREPAKSDNPGIPSWSPSGFRVPGKDKWAPMSDAEIEQAIDEFVVAAARAKAIGFDCVEFHGAHSYLLDAFFWERTNLREDAWGGDWEGRTRLAATVIARARSEVGPDFPLIIRLSQWKQIDFDARTAESPEALEKWLSPLKEAGVDAFHCSQRRFWEPTYEGSDLNDAGWAKKVSGLPTISVGSVGLDGEFTALYGETGGAAKPAALDGLVDRMAREEFDLIAVGRALLQDPDWAMKVREGRFDQLRTFDKSALATLS